MQPSGTFQIRAGWFMRMGHEAQSVAVSVLMNHVYRRARKRTS